MTDDEHVSEKWTSRDDRLFAFDALPPGHPIRVVTQFFSRVLAGAGDVFELGQMVTPESRDSWGDDFALTREIFETVEDYAFGSHAETAEGAVDVAYVKMFLGVKEGYTSQGGEILRAKIFTLVWRPELDGWRIHAYGLPAAPEYMPRTSPGIAPSVAP